MTRILEADKADWINAQRLLDTNGPSTRDTQIGECLRMYLSESVHSGFEGFSSRDVTGIRRFITDFYRAYTVLYGSTSELDQ